MSRPRQQNSGFSNVPKSQASEQKPTKSLADQANKKQHAVELINKGKLQEAEAIYRALIAEGTSNHIVYGNLAALCAMQGRFDEPIRLLRRALELKPNYPDAHYNLGIALQKQGHLDDAIASYRTAIELKPNYQDAHHNLGAALQEQGDLDAAIASYKTALRLKPNYPDAHNNMGAALQEQGDLDAAIASYKTALKLKPNYPDAQANLSQCLLQAKDYINGWHKYEYRHLRQKPSLPHASPDCQRWEPGNQEESQRLLLVSEQGLGDTMQFMRYANALRSQGLLVSVCAQPKLHTLIQASGIDPLPLSPQQANQVSEGYWIPLLSVPKHLAVSPENPIVTEPYIKTTDELRNKWKGILSAEQRPIIGINWQGNPSHEKANSSGRSLPLETFATVARQTNTALLSLQKGFGSQQLDNCSFKDRFVSCQDQISDTWDFVETAAIIANCDLVITSDTSVAHLAGGMGKTTWLLLKKVPEWRWGLEGDTTFWYPSMRLFRQKERGNWEEVMGRVTEALQEHFRSKSTPAISAIDTETSIKPEAMPRQTAEHIDHTLIQKNAEDLIREGRIAEAEALYIKLISAKSRNHIVYGNLATICGSRGEYKKMMEYSLKALSLKPNYPEALNGLGYGYLKTGEIQKAITSLEKAIECDSKYAGAYNNLGNAYRELWHLDESIWHYEQATKLDPSNASYHHNLAIALNEKSAPTKAINALGIAISLKPNYYAAILDLAMIELQIGNYKEGLKRYESRLKASHTKNLINGTPKCKRWEGEPIGKGKQLLLVSEQGLGDTLQFMRYVVCLREKGFNVSIAAPVKLHGLIKQSKIDDSPLSPDEANQIQDGYWCPLLSTLQYLGVNQSNPVTNNKYIKASTESYEKWQQLLENDPRPIIGINWQGNPKHEAGSSKGRSIALELFEPLVQNFKGTFVSLQKGPGSEQLQDCAFKDKFASCQSLINEAWDFNESAAIIQNCDLIITSDTSVAHLAGGIGKETWLLLKKVPEWRWGLNSNRSIWYPSMRLFRQREVNSWEGVVQDVKKALRKQYTSEETTADQDRLKVAITCSTETSINKLSNNFEWLIKQATESSSSDIPKAIKYYREAIKIKPQAPELHNNLGNLLRQNGNIKEAISAYQAALEIRKDYVDALNNLGVTHKESGDSNAAIQAFLSALKINNSCNPALINLSVILKKRGDLDNAIACLEDVIQRNPDSAATYLNLGSILHDAGKYSKAISIYRQGLEYAPNDSNFYHNLGITYGEQGRLKESISSYEKAFELSPSDLSIQKNLAMAYLMSGKYQQGWQMYESRLLDQDLNILGAKPKTPKWCGISIPENGKVLLVGEQGLGDTLHFARYAKALTEQGIEVAICAQNKLHALLEESKVCKTVLSPEEANLITDQEWLPLLSLPGHLNVTPDNPIFTEPYLKTKDELIKKWNDILAAEKRPIIGINWQGNPSHEKTNSKGRSIKLEEFAPIAGIKGISLVSLQKGFGSEQIKQCSFKGRFVSCQSQIDKAWDFLETAAIMANCDLVITSDTSAAHLAAAIGKETWLLLKKVPEWRWGLEGETSHWYPSMRLFRQKINGEWSDVFASVVNQLEDKLGRKRNNHDPERHEMNQVEIDKEKHARSLNNAANKHQEDGDLDKAINLYEKSLELNPNFWQAINNLGNAQQRKGNIKYATELYRKAIKIRPNYAAAHNNLGNALKEQGNISNAVLEYKKAIELDAHYPEAHFNLSIALMLLGDYQSGWKEYEWRAGWDQSTCKPYAMPKCQKLTKLSDLTKGLQLLLVCEQGIGDTLQFIRYCLMLKDRRIDVILCCHAKLEKLLETADLNLKFLSPQDSIHFNKGLWLPLLSLPRLLGVSAENPLINEPYIKHDSHLYEKWKRLLSKKNKLIIGINWQGNPQAETQSLRGRSFPLEVLQPISKMPNIRLASLQKGFGSDQLQNCSFRDCFVDCQDQITETWDFQETAAVIANCDLLITSDTSVAHLAAAMGRPTWLMLQKVPDWRWGLEGKETAWYPSMRLFRQTTANCWETVIEAICLELNKKYPLDQQTFHTTSLEQSSKALEKKALQLAKQGETTKASEILKTIVQNNQASYTTYANLGATEISQQNYDLAIQYLDQAIQIQPNHAEAHHNLGHALRLKGEHDKALDSYRVAYKLKPSNQDFASSLGKFLVSQGKYNEAIEILTKSLQDHPNSSVIKKGLGRAFRAIGKIRIAIQYLEEATKSEPLNKHLWIYLGDLFNEMKEYKQAIGAYRQAISLDADSIALNNLSVSLKAINRKDEAIECLKQALNLDNSNPGIHVNLGNIHIENGHLDKSINSYKRALLLDQANLAAHKNIAFAYLLTGNYHDGWNHYEYRLLKDKGEEGMNLNVNFGGTPWNGEVLSELTHLYLVTEQGLGDTLQFCRYAKALNKEGISTTFCAPSKLLPLIKYSGLDNNPICLEDSGQIGNSEWIPLLSLPKILNINPQRPLITQPYLKAPQELIQKWRKLLRKENKPLIGINWQGNPKSEVNVAEGRSLELDLFSNFIAETDARFVSLQKGCGSEQLGGYQHQDKFVGCQKQITNTLDFLETAAIIANCDLVITSDTCVAHLAGGLGKQTWLLLKKIPDWRWGLEGQQTAWYPSVRLFRQDKIGDWDTVMKNVSKHFKRKEWLPMHD